MNFFLLGDVWNGMLGVLMAFLSLFLIMLILIQRGKGGGLTGALGGPGGQSAFGSKAGDTFTLVTVVVASIWGFTCAFAMWRNVDHSGNDLDLDQKVAVQGMGSEDIAIDPENKGNGDSELTQGDLLGQPEAPAPEAAAPEAPAPEAPAPEATGSNEAPESSGKN